MNSTLNAPYQGVLICGNHANDIYQLHLTLRNGVRYRAVINYVWSSTDWVQL